MKTVNVLALGDSLIQAKADSLRGWSRRFAERYAEESQAILIYHNRSEDGDTTIKVLKRLPSVLRIEKHWDMLVLGVGINDSRRRGHPPTRYEIDIEVFRANFQRILSAIHGYGNIDRIICANIIPVIERYTTPFKEDKYHFISDSMAYANVIVEEVTTFPRVKLLDFNKVWNTLSEQDKLRYLPDGLHPGPQGHEFLSNIAWMYHEKHN